MIYKIYMGNCDCCQNYTESQQYQDSRFMQTGQQVQQLPCLSDEIHQFLNTKQPFKQDFALIRQHQCKKIKIGTEVYQGLFNLKGQPNGYAKCYKQDGSLYIGRYQDGQMTAQFYHVLPNGSYYYGQTQKGFICKGIFEQQGFVYEGAFLNNCFHGEGTEITQDYQFEGLYDYGIRVKGKLSWKYNNFNYVYEGEFDRQGNFNGHGVLTEVEGVYDGQFLDGAKHGQGKYKFSNSGLIYEGNYYKGFKQGKGKLINSDNTISYEGEFLKGLPHGKGIAFKQNLRIQTQFEQGIPKASYQKLRRYQVSNNIQ